MFQLLDKKLLAVLAVLLAVLMLAGCGKDDKPADMPDEPVQTPVDVPVDDPVDETLTDVADPKVAEMIKAGVLVGDFSYIDMGSQSKSTVPYTEMYQINEDKLFLVQEHFSSASDILLTVYNMKTGEVERQTTVPISDFINTEIYDDKIILKDEKEFYWLPLDLQKPAECVALPQVMFEGESEYTPSYTVSSDLQHIVYSSSELGMNWYDRRTGELRQMLMPYTAPYSYIEDFNWWSSPYGLSFLPGDRQVMFMVAGVDVANGLWVVDMQGQRDWLVTSEDLGDIWDMAYDINWSAEKFAAQPVTKTERVTKDGQTYAQSYVRMIDVRNSELTEWAKVDFPVETFITAFNDDYFTFNIQYDTHTDLMLVDKATLTPKKVLTVDNCFVEADGITEDGRVLFVCTPTIDSEFFEQDFTFTGLTAAVE
ncbi:MAG: hypothetical protein IJE29_03580 [Firmicutes bacterium]|nr:hypothetical protein [Bacillota bacterium]